MCDREHDDRHVSHKNLSQTTQKCIKSCWCRSHVMEWVRVEARNTDLGLASSMTSWTLGLTCTALSWVILHLSHRYKPQVWHLNLGSTVLQEHSTFSLDDPKYSSKILVSRTRRGLQLLILSLADNSLHCGHSIDCLLIFISVKHVPQRWWKQTSVFPPSALHFPHFTQRRNSLMYSCRSLKDFPETMHVHVGTTELTYV